MEEYVKRLLVEIDRVADEGTFTKKSVDVVYFGGGTPTALTALVTLGVFQLGLSYVLYVKASKFCPPLACCLLGAVEPLLNPVWVFLFNGERPGVFALLGAVVVIVSITLWSIFGQERAA